MEGSESTRREVPFPPYLFRAQTSTQRVNALRIIRSDPLSIYISL